MTISSATSSISARRPTLSNRRLDIVFNPDAGGRVERIRHAAHGDILVPMGDLAFDRFSWPKAGAFPLIPYHNRLHDACFRFHGRKHRVTPNAANGRDAMHGPAQRRPWHVTLEDATQLVMSLDYEADDDWPFDFSASQVFTLDGDRLSVDLTLTNTGHCSMLCGLGWHPYFSRDKVADGTFTPGSRWEIDADTAQPSRVATPSVVEIAKVEIGKALHYSECTQISLVSSNDLRIDISGEGAISSLVVLRTADYVCLEPVSHIAGALSGLPHGIPGTGLRILEPGEAVSGTVRLTMTSTS